MARLVAVPPGAEVQLRVLNSDYIDIADVDMEVGFGAGDEVQTGAAFVPVRSEYLGILRGVEAHALRFYIYDYDALKRTLRVYTRLRVEVRFSGGRTAKVVSAVAAGTTLHAAFLNSAQAAAFRTTPAAAKVQADTWYDPTQPWVKVRIDEDGIYRIDRAWLAQFTETEAIDLSTLRLFYRGQEQRLYLSGGDDASFDDGAELLFYGRYRRGERDFENLYGRRNTYWLTWGGAEGLRFGERDAAPTNGYGESHSFWTTAHFERDLIFAALAAAPNAERDHWFWTLNNKALTATKPDVPSSAEFPGDLLFPDLDREYQAKVRVALHGASDLGHHTVLKLNARYVLSDSIWGGKKKGMVEFLAEAAVPSALLKNGRNRILLQVFADQEKFDLMWFNWFEIDYFRRYVANGGFLEATHPTSAGHRITVENLTHEKVVLFELNGGVRLTGLTVAGADSAFTATFEDVAEQEARYVIADSLSIKTPFAIADESSNWRNFDGADYLVIAHPLLMAQAERLAEHRRGDGLVTAAISSDDLYDEFGYGLIDAEAIRAFIRRAYHAWPRAPTYVLFLADETWDYRNIIGGGRPTIVPSLYYQSRGRGLAPSDFLYALVDGNDLLADLSIGRLAASSQNEADVVVGKVIDYDIAPEPGAWRARALYAANDHILNFIAPSDSLAARYTEKVGLSSVKVYNPDEAPIPNPTGRRFVEALNDGALLLNFSGHGSPGTMQSIFTLDLPDWGYLAQVQNGRRLPLVLALSCLNGLFANPTVEGLAEVFTNRAEGGAIAYISASAKSFVAQNNLLSDRMYRQFFVDGNLAFGPALDVAKAEVLAAHSSWVDAALTMQLVGDPAQKLALTSLPDYVALGLDIAADEVRGQQTLEVETRLANYGRLSTDSLRVLLLAHATEAAQPETLMNVIEKPFAGERTLTFAWPLGARRGAYRLELLLDAADRLPELDENNNRLSIELDILEPLLAIAIFPAANAVLAAAELTLEAAVPVDGGAYRCEFALSTEPSFAAAQLSPLIEPENGLAIYRPALADDTVYFWRVRLHSGVVPGPWSAGRSLRTGTSTGTGARENWSQRGRQLFGTEARDVELVDESLVLSSVELPLRPDSTTREDGFTVRDLAGAGVLVTDGIWLYAKRWYNDASTLYPGSDYFTRVGTGLNETFKSGNFGAWGDSTTAGISATYHSDGYIYSESGRAFEIERLLVATGTLDTVAVPDGLLEWKYGRIEDGHSLITSDGTFIYNVAMSTEQGVRNAWRVRVFDPANDWALVREFTSPPTANGFTFEWTDGILADGEHIYLIEWQGQRRIRMIDAFDGSFIDEWQSDQDITRVITGQYDWINNKVWLGDLWSSAIFRYRGLGRVETAEVLSAPIGAAAWRVLTIEGDNIAVDLLVPRGEQWVPHDELNNIEPGRLSLEALDAQAFPQVRLRARLQHPDARLRSWGLDFVPPPELELTRAEGQRSIAGLALEVVVRNLSAQAVKGALLTLEQSGEERPLRQIALSTLARGETRVVRVDSLDLPPLRKRIFATLSSGLPDASPGDNRLEVSLLIEGRLPLKFVLWPEGRSFLSGDPLLSGQGLLVSAPAIGDGEIELRIDGQLIEPDSLIDAFPEPPRLLFRPQLAPGRHQVEARLLRAGEELGLARLELFAGDALRISNVLLYPHPVLKTTAFTYVLSQPAEVEVEIFSLSGRLVRRLRMVATAPGFGQVPWDGRDEGGRRLANGTYLYRIAALSRGEEVVFRGALVILR